jgi:plastocyanin
MRDGSPKKSVWHPHRQDQTFAVPLPALPLVRRLFAWWILGSAALPAAETGTLTGVVPLPARRTGRIAIEKYSGSISGKVGPAPPVVAAVWLEGPGLAAPARPPRVSFSQKGYQFTRSLLVVPRGTVVEFPNEDPDYHNIFSLSRTLRFDLGRYKKSETPPPSATFDRPGLVRLQCEIHEHMKALVRVVDSPHFTTSDAAGKFTLAGVPAGTYTLHAQADEKNLWRSTVTVLPRRVTPVTLAPATPAP